MDVATVNALFYTFLYFEHKKKVPAIYNRNLHRIKTLSAAYHGE
jgi:hypothetical protein